MPHLHEALAESRLRLQFPVCEPQREGDVVKFVIESGLGDYDLWMPLYFRTAAGIISPDRFEEPQRDADGKIVAPGAYYNDIEPDDCTIVLNGEMRAGKAALMRDILRQMGHHIVEPPPPPRPDFSDVVDLADSFLSKAVNHDA